jgi:hypothetical protein
MAVTSTNTSKRLLKKYLEWQESEGEKKTVQQFSEYVNVGYKLFAQVFNGSREPSKHLTIHLANFFDDQGFYDDVETPRHDPNLQFVERHWGKIPLDVQIQITRLLTPYTKDQVPSDEGVEVANKRAVE